MAHESPTFLSNQRQLGTAETTAGLTGQLPGPSQSYFYDKGILKTSSSNKIDLLTLYKQLAQQRKRKKCLLFYFCAIGVGKISDQQKTVIFSNICMNRRCTPKVLKIPT